MIRPPPRSTLFPSRRSSDLRTRTSRRATRCFVSNPAPQACRNPTPEPDRKSTRLNSSHGYISYSLFFFNDTAPTEIYTLSLTTLFRSSNADVSSSYVVLRIEPGTSSVPKPNTGTRSEKHTSELQSRLHLLFPLFF